MPVSLRKTAAPVDADRVAIDHLANAVEDLQAIRAHLAALKDEESELLTVIRAAIGTASVGTVGGEDAVLLDERTNTSLDRPAVKTLLGAEAYASVLRLTPYVATVLVGRFKNGSRK